MNPLARARINARRDLVRHGYGQLYEAIQQILLKHNPACLDLTRGDAREDYGLPTGTLIPRLGTADEQSLQLVLYGEMKHSYPQEAGASEQYEAIAHEIWQAWITFQRPSN